MKNDHKKKYTDIGLKIGYHRKRKGLSQEQLAEKIGKSVSHVSSLEAPNVHVGISLDTLFDIAHALGVPDYKLLKWEEA